MMRRIYMVVLVAMLAALGACAPKAAPVTAQSPAAPQAIPAPATAATPLPAVEDVAWARVVQAAQREGVVNVYSYSWRGDVGLAMSRAFQKRYGLRLEIVTGRGSEFLERLKTEARMGRVTGDLWEGAGTHSENARLAGLLAPAGDLPVLQDRSAFAVNPLILSPDGYHLNYTRYYYGWNVNTNLVKPGEEPKAWVDLLEPRWKGRIAMVDPVGGTGPAYMSILIDMGRLSPDFPAKLGKQNLLFSPNAGDVVNKLARGEAAIGQFASQETSAVAQQGAPVRFIDLREGIFGIGLSLGAIKDGPHPNATRLLQNWVLSQEGQDVYGKAIAGLSVRNDVPDYQHPDAQVKPQNLVFLNVEQNDLVAKVVRERQLVPLLKPK